MAPYGAAEGHPRVAVANGSTPASRRIDSAPDRAAERDADTGAEDAPGVTRRFVDTAAIGLIVVELLIRAWSAFQGYYSLDDFAFARLATEKGLGTDLLFTPYNSHFMPGAYLMVWLETTYAPMNYTVVAAVAIAGMAIAFLLSWLLIRRLAGPRLMALIPLAVIVTSPITLPTTLWWAVSINQLAMVIAIPGALLAHLTYLRTGRMRYAALTVLTVVLALPFYEKIVLVVPLLWVFTVIIQPDPGLRERVLRATMPHLRVWGSFVLLGVIFAGVYLSRPLDKRADTPVDLGGLLGNAATSSVPSGLVGGPWSWTPVGAVDASAHPPTIGRIIALVLIVGLIGLTVYRRPLAWQPWALLGGALLFDVAVLAVGRLQLGSGAAMEYRYFTDLAPIGGIALCLALFGPPRWAAIWPEREGLIWPPWNALVTPDENGIRGGFWPASADGPKESSADRNAATAAVIPIVAALALSSLVSIVNYSERWHKNPAEPYVTNATTSINEFGRTVDLYNGAVPEKVLWNVLVPTNYPSRMLAPLHLNINPDPDVSTDLHVLDTSGRLRRAQVTSATIPPGPVANCGWRITNPWISRLDKTLFNWWWYAEIHYSAKQAAKVLFVSAKTKTMVDFQAGEHVVWVKVTGPASSVGMVNVPRSAGLCVNALTVGLATPGGPVN
jgi:hypothetical protein